MNPRPLIVRFGALGDMTILTVMIRLLYERFGERVDIVGSGSWTRPLLEGQYGVGDLYLIESRRWPYFASPEQWALTRTLRARGPSATWLCDQENQKILRVLKWAGWTAAHSCNYLGFQDLPWGPHMGDLWQRFAFRDPQVLGGTDHPLPRWLPQAHAKLSVDSSLRRATTEWLTSQGIGDHPLILIQAGNKRTMRGSGHRRRASNTKYWPELNWCAVLRGLREQHPDHAILLLGTPAEESLNNDIRHLANIPQCYNLARDVPIPRLMALAERATGTISVDTGPAHVAAATGCSVVTLFGKASPILYAPRGPDTQVVCLTGTCDGEQSMLGITPQQVLDAWLSISRSKRASDRFSGLSTASKVDSSQRPAHQFSQPLPESARQRV